MFEIPKTETGPVLPKKETKIKPEEASVEEGLKKKFRVEVFMDSLTKDGEILAKKASEISKVAESVEVEATSKEEASEIALEMDFGKRIPSHTDNIEEIKTGERAQDKIPEKQKEKKRGKDFIEKETVSEKLKDEAMGIVKRVLRERQRPLKPDELKIVAPNLGLFSEDAQEIIIAAFGGGISITLAEQKSTRKKSTKE